MDGFDGNHKAEGLFKLLQKEIGPKQNWDPEQVQRKFVYKSDKIFKSKQDKLRPTQNFIDEERFAKKLKNGDNFIACFETKNIKTENIRDGQMADDVSRFLYSSHQDQFIWAPGRSYSNPKKPFEDYCKDFFQIPDLNFGADRRNPLKVLCPISDILVLILIEENHKVSILFNKTFLKIKNHRSKQYLKPTSKYTKYFKTSNGLHTANKENVNPSGAGPSGLQSSQPGSIRSNSAASESNSAGSGSNDRRSDNDPCSSDEESDDDHADDTRNVVFKSGYAEITSYGITQKIEIGSKKDYPKITSKVGFQIDTIQFILRKINIILKTYKRNIFHQHEKGDNKTGKK